MSKDFLFCFYFLTLFQHSDGIKEQTCEGETMTLNCNNTKIIDIIIVHYGRFNGVQCSNGYTHLRCNDSIIANGYIEEKCQNCTTCSIPLNVLQNKNCSSQISPYLEVVYDCKINQSVALTGNTSTSGTNGNTLGAVGTILIVIGGIVCFVVIIVGGFLLYYRVIRKGGYYDKKSNSEGSSSVTADTGLQENHYDEISMADDDVITGEYNHIKFRRSFKPTPDNYNHTEIGTYDHTSAVPKLSTTTKNTEYMDSSASLDDAYSRSDTKPSSTLPNDVHRNTNSTKTKNNTFPNTKQTKNITDNHRSMLPNDFNRNEMKTRNNNERETITTNTSINSPSAVLVNDATNTQTNDIIVKNGNKASLQSSSPLPSINSTKPVPKTRNNIGNKKGGPGVGDEKHQEIDKDKTDDEMYVNYT